jgi:hypothetical protein
MGIVTAAADGAHLDPRPLPSVVLSQARCAATQFGPVASTLGEGVHACNMRRVAKAWILRIQLYKVQLLRAAARYLGGRGGEGPMAVPDCMRAVHEKAKCLEFSGARVEISGARLEFQEAQVLVMAPRSARSPPSSSSRGQLLRTVYKRAPMVYV